MKENLLRRSLPEPNSGCWLWMEGCSGDGYGAVTIRKMVHKAHRVSYMIFKGPIPEGMNLLHRCDTRLCINPDHLFLGTLAENNWDRDKKGRTAKGERSGKSKLTDAQVLEIRAEEITSPKLECYKALGIKYGVTHGHISKILRGELRREGGRLPYKKYILHAITDIKAYRVQKQREYRARKAALRSTHKPLQEEW